MKIFLDTNIFVEYIEERHEVETVAEILEAIADGKHQGFLSQGGFYTLTFLLERALRHKGIYKPILTDLLRRVLGDILSTATVVGISHKHFLDAVGDAAFSDLEDSFQYHCALENECDVLITINIKDYKDAGSEKLKVMTPFDFAERYL